MADFYPKGYKKMIIATKTPYCKLHPSDVVRENNKLSLRCPRITGSQPVWRRSLRIYTFHFTQVPGEHYRGAVIRNDGSH